ncbi:hypothetical protein MTO96_039805 [Rhipicephalus appendiculatus]
MTARRNSIFLSHFSRPSSVSTTTVMGATEATGALLARDEAMPVRRGDRLRHLLLARLHGSDSSRPSHATQILKEAGHGHVARRAPGGGASSLAYLRPPRLRGATLAD